jgi:hypothetical protein
LPLCSAYGVGHPRVRANVARRAGLARKLGDEAEARRLEGADAPPPASAAGPAPGDVAAEIKARLRELGVPAAP